MSNVEFSRLARELAGKNQGSSSILLLSIISFIAVAIMWAAVMN